MVPDERHFPDAEEVKPHAMAFARLMFAHARFESGIRELQSAITGCQSFGEQRDNQWNARVRPERMAKLIKDKLGDIEEAEPIAAVLEKSKKPSDDRNILAHGIWWCFNRETSALTVRSGTIWKGVGDINRVADTFDDLEADLYKIRRQIEKRRASPDAGCPTLSQEPPA
jgi:hypothetical protein